MSDLVPKSQKNARKSLVVFFAVLVLLSGIVEWKLIRLGNVMTAPRYLTLCLMWCPAVASFVARLIFREGISDVGFRFGGVEGLKSTVQAWLYPLAVASVAYGIAWTFGLAVFKPPFFTFANGVFIAMTIGTFNGCFRAAGEEIGWRGYLVPRLIDAGVPRPILLSGIIWVSWHLPLLIAGSYVTSGGGMLVYTSTFAIDVIFAGYLSAFWRLKSGSVWPAVVFHAAWNAVIQGPFDGATAGSFKAVGESGYLVITADILFIIIIVYGTWKMLRKPGEEMQLPSGKPASFPSNL